jgi:hypothetical protein
MQINVMLRNNLEKAVHSESFLFKKYQEIAQLNRPNHLIIKPIFAVMVLIRTFP